MHRCRAYTYYVLRYAGLPHVRDSQVARSHCRYFAVDNFEPSPNSKSGLDRYSLPGFHGGGSLGHLAGNNCAHGNNILVSLGGEIRFFKLI